MGGGGGRKLFGYFLIEINCRQSTEIVYLNKNVRNTVGTCVWKSKKDIFQDRHGLIPGPKTPCGKLKYKVETSSMAAISTASCRVGGHRAVLIIKINVLTKTITSTKQTKKSINPDNIKLCENDKKKSYFLYSCYGKVFSLLNHKRYVNNRQSKNIH